MRYNFRTVNAYIAQCRWRRKIPTWRGIAAFAVRLKLTRRVIEPEPIEPQTKAKALYLNANQSKVKSQSNREGCYTYYISPPTKNQEGELL